MMLPMPWDYPPRQARELLTEWTNAGWLELGDAARKSRRYHLSAFYRLNNGGVTRIFYWDFAG